MKRISPATVTFGVMAIVLGLVAAFVVRQSLRKAPVVAVQPPPPPPPDLVGVVIATKNIPRNTQIQLSDMVIVNVPKDHPSTKTTVRHPANAIGRIAKQHVRAGQVIRDEYLLGIGETLPDLAERIPAGHRAVTIDVVGASTGGKRLTEGDYIDIALTVEGDHPDLGEIQTRTLMRNVMIVDAVASEALRSTSRNQAITQQRQSSSITVAVTEADANRLIVAERSGTLSVTLCSAQDPNNLANDTTISRKDLLGLAPIPQPEPPPPPPVVIPPPKRIVESYNGGSRQLLEFDEGKIKEAEESSKLFTPNNVTEPVSKEIDQAQQREAVRKLSPFASAAAK